jgi:hypothetical protein
VRLEDPLSDLRPAPPATSLRSRVLIAAAERQGRSSPRATPVTGAYETWILVMLTLLFAHAWVTSASERASAELLLSLGVPGSSATASLGVYHTSELE